MSIASLGAFRTDVLYGATPWSLHPDNSLSEASSASAQQRKLRRAAQEFESVLIATWWKSAAQSFSGLADEEEEGGLQAFRDFGLEAMSLAIAQAGGLGIGRMLLQKLEPGMQPAKASEKEV